MTQDLHSAPLRIAFIQAAWHRDIVDQARKAFLAHLEALAGRQIAVDLHEVPGAFEIPLLAQRLAQGGRHAAVVCTGLVVDGGIYRHDFVAEAVIQGLMRVQLDTGVPVLSGVLTPHHFHEHAEHQAFFQKHFLVKGEELARAALRVLAIHDRPVPADRRGEAVRPAGARAA